MLNTLAAVLLASCPCPTEASGFAGGSGTPADPYLVCDAAQLDRVRDDLEGHYRLTADVDLDGVSWTPIADGTFGDDSLLFTFITATEEDDENEIYPMPPDEKERLSEKQINLIREWIESGAPWTGGDALPDTHTD